MSNKLVLSFLFLVLIAFVEAKPQRNLGDLTSAANPLGVECNGNENRGCRETFAVKVNEVLNFYRFF